MSTMAEKTRKDPIFRLGDVLGPHLRRSYERTLSEELHRRFDAVAGEDLPPTIVALIDLLAPGPSDDSGEQTPPQAS
jgi:hypothetical protein